jgi:hypothetical protein
LALTWGNVAACDIDTATVYVHPYFFSLSEAKQLGILYHELVSHILNQESDEQKALEDTKRFITQPAFEGLLQSAYPLDRAIEEISVYKQENETSLNERSESNPFITKLQEAALKIYNKYKLYSLPIKDRLLYCNVVFDQEQYFRVYITVNSLYNRLDIDAESIASILAPHEYYYLASFLSDIEQEYYIQDNRNIRFAINLVFDFWEYEKRILEQKSLIEQIESELNRPGSGNLPLIAAMQDIHGGARRALSLIGFVLGLTQDVYPKINTLDDLRSLLLKSGIDINKISVRFAGLNDKSRPG